MDLKGRKVLVLGLGETGLSIARWVAREGGTVRVADTRAAPPALADLRAALPQAEVLTGPFSDALLEGVALVAASPGVPIAEPVVQAALARGADRTARPPRSRAAPRDLGARALELPARDDPFARRRCGERPQRERRPPRSVSEHRRVRRGQGARVRALQGPGAEPRRSP